MKRFSVRLPDNLHEELRRRAYEEDISINQIMLKSMREFIDSDRPVILGKYKNNPIVEVETGKEYFVNTFHDVHATVTPKRLFMAKANTLYGLSQEQIDQLNKELCGKSLCTCGGIEFNFTFLFEYEGLKIFAHGKDSNPYRNLNLDELLK